MFRFGDPGGRVYATTANIVPYWSSAVVGGGTSLAVPAGASRHDGGSCLRFALTGTAANIHLDKTLDAQPTWGAAFGFRASSLPAGGGAILTFFDGASLQVDLRLEANGTLTLTRNGTTLAGSANSLAPGVWNHLEAKVTFHNTAGNYEVRVNGTSAGWIPAQGGTANTRATANNSASVVKIGWGIWGTPNSGTINLDFDDLIVWDTQATDPNGFADVHDWVGDRGLYWLLPSGPGTTTQWTPDAGSNYARVNEAAADGDLSYVSSGTAGQVDTYTLADLPARVSGVAAAAAVHYARKDDVGSRGMKSVLRSAGANATHAAEIALANGYLYYFQSWGQDPNAGAPAAWSVAAVNGLELGQIVSS